jgi:hypothetical protein
MKIIPRWLDFPKSSSFIRFIVDVLLGGHRNVIRFLRTIFFMALAVPLGDFLKRSWGISEWIGYPIAFVVICLLTWAVLLGRILLFFPFPSCRKGKCHSIDDYEWCYGCFFGKFKWGVYWYLCHCGDQYLRRGKRFMEFIPEVTVPPSPWVNINKGTTRPYKILIGFRKWADDTDTI